MTYTNEYRALSRAYSRIRNARELIEGTEVPETAKNMKEKAYDDTFLLEQDLIAMLEEMEK